MLNYVGIQLLQEIPIGIPDIYPPQLIPNENLEDIPKLLEHLKPKYQNWWRDWLNDQPLPSIVVPEGIGQCALFNILRDSYGFLVGRFCC
jgi:hypothetical protein